MLHETVLTHVPREIDRCCNYTALIRNDLSLYEIAAVKIILSDLRGYSPTVSLFKWDFSYSSVAIDKISNDNALTRPFILTSIPIYVQCRVQCRSLQYVVFCFITK